MTRAELKQIEGALAALLAKVRSLGGYDAHAETEMIIVEVLYELTKHLREKAK